MGAAMKPGMTADEAKHALLEEVKHEARLLFIKIHAFRPIDSDLKAILEGANCSSDLRRRQTWQTLHALLLEQQRCRRQERAAAALHWEEQRQQWAQWLVEFQQTLQARERCQDAYQYERSQPLQPWQILEVDPATATGSEIKRAYRRLALQHHPDRGGCAERFLAIRQAYELLMATAS